MAINTLTELLNGETLPLELIISEVDNNLTASNISTVNNLVFTPNGQLIAEINI